VFLEKNKKPRVFRKNTRVFRKKPKKHVFLGKKHVYLEKNPKKHVILEQKNVFLERKNNTCFRRKNEKKRVFSKKLQKISMANLKLEMSRKSLK